ncbi:ribosomal protein S18-alanine N-acetyltransferase [Granulicatella balaenopterae]
MQKLMHQMIDGMYMDEEDYQLLRRRLAFTGRLVPLYSGEEAFMRLAKREEYGDIFRLEQLAYDGKSPWHKEMFYKDLNRNPRTIYIIMEYNGEKIAFLGARTTDGYDLHISNICVLPQYRCLGCASALIVQLVQFAEILAKKEITLEVRQSNSKAIRLYQRMGFIKTGIKPEYYQPEKEDAIEMTFELQRAL